MCVCVCVCVWIASSNVRKYISFSLLERRGVGEGRERSVRVKSVVVGGGGGEGSN